MLPQEAKGPTKLNLRDMLHLPKNNIRVPVAVENPTYQAFLSAGRALEEARERDGYVSSEYFDALREATANMDAEAKRLLAGDRAHGQ